jgi:hypothetical protein
MQISKVSASLLIATVLLFGCKKDDTAKVQYSEWFTPDAFTVTTSFGTINFNYTKTAPDITQDILDKGGVLVFGKLNGYSTSLWPADQVALLPIQVYYKIGSAINIDTWSASTTAGSLRINLVSSVNAYDGDQSISHSHAFRYVIVPPGKKLELIKRSPAGTLGYAELCNALNIPQ